MIELKITRQLEGNGTRAELDSIDVILTIEEDKEDNEIGRLLAETIVKDVENNFRNIQGIFSMDCLETDFMYIAKLGGLNIIHYSPEFGDLSKERKENIQKILMSYFN